MTGKPLEAGGIEGRTEATGLGVFLGSKEFLENEAFTTKHGITPCIDGKEIIVQGFGNVGFWAAKFFSEANAKVVGVVEYNSAVYCKAGLNVSELKEYQTQKGEQDSLRTLPGGWVAGLISVWSLTALFLFGARTKNANAATSGAIAN